MYTDYSPHVIYLLIFWFDLFEIPVRAETFTSETAGVYFKGSSVVYNCFAVCIQSSALFCMEGATHIKFD